MVLSTPGPVKIHYKQEIFILAPLGELVIPEAMCGGLFSAPEVRWCLEDILSGARPPRKLSGERASVYSAGMVLMALLAGEDGQKQLYEALVSQNACSSSAFLGEKMGGKRGTCRSTVLANNCCVKLIRSASWKPNSRPSKSFKKIAVALLGEGLQFQGFGQMRSEND